GRIMGKFIIPTDYLRMWTTVLAFDSYGYFIRTADVNIYALTYVIEDLPPGDYYLMTFSDQYAYVDEMYDNVPAPLFSRDAWQDANKVTVTEGADTENIDFELQPSAEYFITLYYPNGNVAGEDLVTFTLSQYDNPEMVIKGEYETWEDGMFTFFVPLLGDFKFGVTLENQTSINWYQSNDDWDNADKLSIPSFSDEVDSIDITVTLGGTGAEFGEISGIVTGNGEFKMIFAFEASDLSFVNMAFIFYSFYTIPDLPPGEYYVYANDYMGNISEDGSLHGTFYQDAITIVNAEIVTVEEGQTTSSINIVLQKGATVMGNVKDEEGNPLEGLPIVALDLQFPNATAFELFTQMNVGMGLTDENGDYHIKGLPSGDYILRTLSDYTIGVFFGIPYLDEGPHKGLIVDEFYSGIYNLFKYESAPRISLQDTLVVENIDFVMQKAKFFKGELYDAETENRINQALMTAFIDSSGYPFYLVPEIGYYGDYELGPLPRGKYRILATANHTEKDFYLPEFYENARTFDDATVLELIDEDIEGLDFGFDKAAVIQGHIDLDAGAGYEPAGEDTLVNFPVVLFDANDGTFKRNAYVQFDGGFRIPRLLPGSYKLVALPIESDFAATYYGGGNDFNDPESQVIQVGEGEMLELNIELEKGGSSIEGVIADNATGQPVNNCLVLAYDETGHAIGLGVTDELVEDVIEIPATGEYKVSGLRADNYYLRTYAFTDETGIATKIPEYLVSAEDPDLFEMIFALLESLFASDMTLYSDSWYGGVEQSNEFDIPELVMSFMIYGMANEYDHARYPFYMPIPFYQSIPGSASSINVGENSTVSDINFELTSASMEDLLLEIEDDLQNTLKVDDFVLLPNYPNPFNSMTNIPINLPHQSKVKVKIYNILGKKITTLVDNMTLPQGLHILEWNGINSKGQELPTGSYFVVFEAGKIRQVAKLMILR
ncbi:T9SS type A sorting domain-containing protein, partial [Bacteroidota bacterium]